MKNSFRLQHILLVESYFKRELSKDFEQDLVNEIDIHVDKTIDGDKLSVYEALTLHVKAGNKKLIEARIKMLAVFEFDKDPVLPIDDFADINAPAIIFPFIREHLAGTSVKAGLQPILLPPVNFVELARRKKADEGR